MTRRSLFSTVLAALGAVKAKLPRKRSYPFYITNIDFKTRTVTFNSRPVPVPPSRFVPWVNNPEKYGS